MINKIKKIEAVFPEAEFFSFRDACQHKNGPVGNFFEVTGVDDFSSLEFINSNTSTSNQVIRLISFINKEQPFFINNKINPCRRNGDTAKLHRIKGNKFQLNENELKKFKDQINQENKYLLKRMAFLDA